MPKFYPCTADSAAFLWEGADKNHNKESSTNIEKPSGIVKVGDLRNKEMFISQELLCISREKYF